MDLSDVLYIIDGSLELDELPGPTREGHRFEARLYDNVHDPCMLQGKDLKPEPGSQWKYATATATGRLRQEALQNLVRRIAGNVLGHDFPIMATSVTEWVRIPPTLVVGDVLDLLNRRRPFRDETEEPQPAA